MSDTKDPNKSSKPADPLAQKVVDWLKENRPRSYAYLKGQGQLESLAQHRAEWARDLAGKLGEKGLNAAEVAEIVGRYVLYGQSEEEEAQLRENEQLDECPNPNDLELPDMDELKALVGSTNTK